VYSTRHLRVHGPLGVLISVERAITELVYRSLAAPLVVCYACAGGGKVAQSRDRLPPMKGWVDRTPMPLVRLIGALELAGAAGLILPPLTGIVPVPAVAAAIGLTLIQIGGIVRGRADPAAADRDRAGAGRGRRDRSHPDPGRRHRRAPVQG
jgi:hypothetical protein